MQCRMRPNDFTTSEKMTECHDTMLDEQNKQIDLLFCVPKEEQQRSQSDLKRFDRLYTSK